MPHGMLSSTLLGSAAAVVIAAATPAARADTMTYGFNRITNSGAPNVGSQLSVTVSTTSTNDILFQFANAPGGTASSICDIYFDNGSNGTLTSITGIINGPGVSFSQGATPGNLPGANNLALPFQTTLGLAADSDAPVAPNGVNPGETLGLRIGLFSGRTFADVISELLSGQLRIGLHVQGLPNGQSDSYVNGGEVVIVPLPPAVLMGSAGLTAVAGLGWVRRRRMT